MIMANLSFAGNRLRRNLGAKIAITLAKSQSSKEKISTFRLGKAAWVTCG